jgi:hypothetical protein
MSTSWIVILSVIGYVAYSVANLAALYYCIKFSKRFRRATAKLMYLIDSSCTARSYEAGLRFFICQGGLFRAFRDK